MSVEALHDERAVCYRNALRPAGVTWRGPCSLCPAGSAPRSLVEVEIQMTVVVDERDVALDYETFMGRWSRVMAARFVDWLAVPAGRRWLEVWGIDPQAEYVARARAQLNGGRCHFLVGDAQALPDELGGFDVAVSALVLNLLADPLAGVRQKMRVTRPGGVVAAYVWDFAAGMRLLRHLWDAATALDPAAATHDQGNRYPLCHPDRLRTLFGTAGLTDIEVRMLEVPTPLRNFDEYWESLETGHGNAPAYVRSLSPRHRERLRERIRGGLPKAADGSIPLTARAWAIRGRRGVLRV